MSESSIELDACPPAPVLHIADCPGIGSLPPGAGQPMGPLDLAEVAALQCRVRSVVDVGEARRDEVSTRQPLNRVQLQAQAGSSRPAALTGVREHSDHTVLGVGVRCDSQQGGLDPHTPGDNGCPAWSMPVDGGEMFCN